MKRRKEWILTKLHPTEGDTGTEFFEVGKKSLDDQCSEFLQLWMAYHCFREFPNLIKYYTSIGNGTQLKEEYNTIGNHTLLQDINNLEYIPQPKFSEDTPNQILNMLSTLIKWLRSFYTTNG